jgi:flagellar capping protein FliD
MEEEGRKKQIISFVDAYNKLKWKRTIKILNQENTSIHKVSFENGKIGNGHTTRIVIKEE